MPAVGGSILSVSVFGRLFAVAADADVTMSMGGMSNEMQANGNGTARMIKTMGTWLLDGLQLEIDDTRGDLEFLQEVADRNEYGPIAFTLASRTVWQGLGNVNGKPERSTMGATAAVGFAGPDKLTQQ